jgi:hypothetical protein
VASLFEPWVTKIDPELTRIDCVFFDGASNVQKGGRLLEAKFPRIHVQACAAHSVSLFFSDISKKLWQIRLMLNNYRRLYRLFGSGAMHSPYALFIAQSKIFNGGRKVGLIKAADTRMAGHSYAQCRMLRLREPLIATISSAAYKDLKLKGFPKKVEQYLMNADMWEATYAVQRCLFPMIRVLRLADKSACGGMSKIVFYVHKTDEAILKSMETLKNLKYFAEHDEEDADDEEGVDLIDNFNAGDDSSNESVGEENGWDSESDAESVLESIEDEEVEVEHLGEQILLFWNQRRQKLITPLALAGWYCSPHADIRADVVAHEMGANRLEVEVVIAKMYYPILDAELGHLIETFWREFDDFQTRRGPSYSRAWIWESDEIKKGNCHLWHKLYSVPFTKVFGKVACRACSKPLGCGLAERNWGALKHLKTGKRSHLSGEKAQMQATVFGAACMERSRVIKAGEESNGVVVESRWTDEDIGLDLGLENWEVAPGIVPVPIRPKRIFKTWLEDWEFEAIHDRDVVAEARLLQKYGGLKWIDPDNPADVFVATDENMEWQGGRGGAGWCVIGSRVRDGDLEPWVLNTVIDEMAKFTQDAVLNVEIVNDAERRLINIERFAEEEKNEKAKRKRGR